LVGFSIADCTFSEAVQAMVISIRIRDAIFFILMDFQDGKVNKT